MSKGKEEEEFNFQVEKPAHSWYVDYLVRKSLEARLGLIGAMTRNGNNNGSSSSSNSMAHSCSPDLNKPPQIPMVPPTPAPQNLPGFQPAPRGFPEIVPLAVFYNGSISLFNLPPEKVELLMQYAETESAKVALPPPPPPAPVPLPYPSIPPTPPVRTFVLDRPRIRPAIYDAHNRGTTTADRKKLIEKYHQKRNERLASKGPYANAKKFG